MRLVDMFALINAPKPSEVLFGLRAIGYLDPEIMALVDVPQDKEHHPEGDAFTHTAMVMDAAAKIAEREDLGYHDSALLRLSALTHDFGKPFTTEVHADGRITAYGHPEKGVNPATDFLLRNGLNNTNALRMIQAMIREHMVHIGFYTPDITSRVVRRIMQRIAPLPIKMLALLVEADLRGRAVAFNQSAMDRMNEIVHVANNIDTIVRPDPIISGDLIMQVLKIGPSRELGEIKRKLYDLQLRGEITSLDEGMAYFRAMVV